MKIYVPGGGARIIPYLKPVSGVDEVITSQLQPSDYGNFLADRSYLLPRFDDPGFLSAMDKLYEKEQFDACIPVMDSTLALFSKHLDRLSTSPFRLGMCPKETVDIGADKLALHDFFSANDFPTASTWCMEDFLNAPVFPCFLKPRFTSSRDFGHGVYKKVESLSQLDTMIRGNPELASQSVVQEFLSGQEINIDFFCDADGCVRSAVAIKQYSMAASRAISQGEIIPDDRYLSWVEAIAAKMRFWGPAQLQLFVSGSGKITLTEINTRISGSMPFVRAAGVDYYYYLVRLLNDEPIRITEKPRKLSMTIREEPFFYEESPGKPLHQ